MRNEDSLATILLVSRIHSNGMRPLSALEYWSLRESCPRPGVLLGKSQTELMGDYRLAEGLATRVVGLMERVRALAFEIEQLEHSGIWTVTPFDDHFPRSLEDRLANKAPALIHAAGCLDLLDQPGIGVVGSRNVSPEGAEVAKGIASKAVDLDLSVTSGGARGVDQLAMNAAFQAGGNVIGILADSLVRKLRNRDVRRAIHDEQAVMCTPFDPKTPFKVWNAMGRNKLIYALSRITLVVTGEVGKGGTWSGAVEALEGGFGRVGVWRGSGEGAGNAVLEERGALAIRSVGELEAVLGPDNDFGQPPPASGSPASEQLSLFGKPA
ncbi:MAG: DNA-protecting protein DprA [Actinomycetia bacterium]|nr:DNA-protecting protein DprA [Actinomycetes bacterium]